MGDEATSPSPLLRRRALRDLLLVAVAAVAVLVGAGVAILSLLPESAAVPTDVDAQLSQPASAMDDIVTFRCDVDATGRTTATGFVRNSTSQTSDYSIHVFDAPDEVVAYVRRLEPSSSRPWTVTAPERTPAPLGCSVTPTRRASATIDGWCSHFSADPRARDAALRVDEGTDTVRLCETES